ncbi:hypothetical protein BT69DRAFT_1276973 [Atractiella rhizophila]|nr:hypothetical protein BT69DRAFT_1276973 [Atractiella rhizophila]
MVLPSDPKGAEKIDINGNLLGGREFKMPSFTFPFRSNTSKVFILAIDAARQIGFRDSLYFFRRNPLVHKIVCTQAEKDYLIDKSILHTNLRGRSVTMVSALNLYKALGAKMVKDGKYVIDDYYEEEALAKGHKPGDSAVTDPYEPGKQDSRDTVAVGVGPRGIPTPSYTHVRGELQFGNRGSEGQVWEPLKVNLEGDSWKFEYMKAVLQTDRWLREVRREGREVVWLGRDKEEGEGEWEVVEEYRVEKEGANGVNGEARNNGMNGYADVEMAFVDEPISSTEPFESIPSPSRAHTRPTVAMNGAASSSSAPRLTNGKGTTDSTPSSTRPSHSPNTNRKRKSSSPSRALPILKRMRHLSPPYGRFEPHTNVPHVPVHTQPCSVSVERIAIEPVLDLTNDEVRTDVRERRAAAKLGVWSVTMEMRSDKGGWEDVWVGGGGKEEEGEEEGEEEEEEEEDSVVLPFRTNVACT